MALPEIPDLVMEPKVDHKKILIVDDEAAIRTLLVDILADPGYELVTAEDGAEAIERMERQRYDLVITDMVMPKANSLDVLLASRELDPERPVIIITGFPSVATAVKLVSLGVSDYITKPFNIDLIKITVAKVIAQREFVADTRKQVEGYAQALPDSIAEPYNFIVFSQLLEKEIARSRLRSHVCSLLVAEIDGFEQAVVGGAINHWNERLQALFTTVKRHVWPGDTVGQTDPDRLSVILPETPLEEAIHLSVKIAADRVMGLGFIVRAVNFPRDAEDVDGLLGPDEGKRHESNANTRRSIKPAEIAQRAFFCALTPHAIVPRRQTVWRRAATSAMMKVTHDLVGDVMGTLAREGCVACRRDSPRVTGRELTELHAHVPNWELGGLPDSGRLSRTFEFDSFSDALGFANAIGEAAEQEGHHPRLTIEWAKATVEWWTYAIGGLHRNDFMMAAKTDEIFAKGI